MAVQNRLRAGHEPKTEGRDLLTAWDIAGMNGWGSENGALKRWRAEDELRKGQAGRGRAS
jgi:hypothetical protein